MSFSLPATIRGLATSLLAPEHRLTCPARLWHAGLAELRRRGGGCRESGAFLLGRRTVGENTERRRVQHFVYYDDLDPHCLDRGIVVFDGAGYGPLWRICRETGLQVVGDVHTHPGVARQSDADRRHPMIATAGHFALIVPDFAQRVPKSSELGVYEYAGAHRWRDHSGPAATRIFYTGLWA
jgi:proteasome lid subunit RPN8/RPN11